MVFEESVDLKNMGMKDDDDLFELLNLQNKEVNGTEDEVNLEYHVNDPSPSEKVQEDNQPTVGPNHSNGASQKDIHPHDNDDF